mmetsp:Transcript_2714/g.6320  ORF Transcript_2714/g.6320 Transcript_2714/m.6320 type:complete len:196 (+) Transcript_2714:58-645(+)
MYFILKGLCDVLINTGVSEMLISTSQSPFHRAPDSTPAPATLPNLLHLLPNAGTKTAVSDADAGHINSSPTAHQNSNGRQERADDDDGRAESESDVEDTGRRPFVSKTQTRKLSVVAQKREGDYFGEIALVQKGAKRTAYIRAQTYCVVEKLTDEVFDDLIKNKHPVAYEKIVARIAKFHNIPVAGEKVEKESGR